ncbi:hypothetical protein Clacol_003383 [Clathrus columnatus]|uniref:Oxysterol-binding protein n=1 Tax=Clathrus columnatus TaxID=1419009 RepID=A0AAV5A823_9AGAM|nr:hypothetical protein Clacol_003383 [Clathrus columnatus]
MSHNDKEEAGDAVPAAQRSSWTAFVKAIATFTGDLSSLTAPPFILSPVSLTEFPAYWAERPDLFAAIATASNEEQRMLSVLRWFIGRKHKPDSFNQSTLRGQYTSRNDSMGSEKKPLNPVLGELFYGYWPDKNGRGKTTLVVEQVSHHPPITAYYISNESKKISLEGSSGQRTSFSGGSIIVKQEGHAVLTIELSDGKKETFLITLPKLRIDGIWYGSPYIELTESSYIQSSSGYLSTINYSGRGYFSGKTHSFKALVTPPGSTSVKHTIEGQWHTTSKDSKGFVFHDVTGLKEEIIVAPIDEQGQWESRRLWKLVAKGIREGDYDLASTEKSRIENEQRQRRKDESAAGETWQLKHFVKSDGANSFKLARIAKLELSGPTYQYLGNGPVIQ